MAPIKDYSQTFVFYCIFKQVLRFFWINPNPLSGPGVLFHVRQKKKKLFVDLFKPHYENPPQKKKNKKKAVSGQPFFFKVLKTVFFFYLGSWTSFSRHRKWLGGPCIHSTLYILVSGFSCRLNQVYLLKTKKKKTKRGGRYS